MMSYIRTKNKIYDERELNNYCGVYYKESLRIGRPVASADTLEELIDEFVVVNNTCFNMPQLLGTEIDKDYYKHEEVYGAVWCEWGLKYVAKLDDKGELHLL